MNGASTDGTLDVLRRYDDRIALGANTRCIAFNAFTTDRNREVRLPTWSWYSLKRVHEFEASIGINRIRIPPQAEMFGHMKVESQC